MVFGSKQCALQLRRAAEAADGAGRADHAVVREMRFGSVAENVADGAGGAWSSGHARDIAVGCHASRRNGRDHAEHAARKRRADLQRMASPSTRPSARGSVMPASNANVGAMSAGVAVVRYRPGLIPQPMRMTGTRWS